MQSLRADVLTILEQAQSDYIDITKDYYTNEYAEEQLEKLVCTEGGIVIGDMVIDVAPFTPTKVKFQAHITLMIVAKSKNAKDNIDTTIDDLNVILANQDSYENVDVITSFPVNFGKAIFVTDRIMYVPVTYKILGYDTISS